MDGETILRLLIVENSRNEAQLYIRALRNARFAVRPEVAEDDEDLHELLGKQAFDLVLSVDELEGVPLERIIAVVREHAAELPVVAITENFDQPHVLGALRAGACNVVHKPSAEQLALVVTQAVTNYSRTTRLEAMQRRLDDSERRCQALLASSRDAIAYAHEGMHIYANSPYLEQFGYESMDDLEGIPLMDMVAADEQEKLKEFLRQFSRGQADGDTLELTGVRPNGSQFPARMEFSDATYEGEPCTQIIIRDESSNLELAAKLDSLSKQDPVTGLLNRKFFTDSLQQWLRQPAGDVSQASLLYLSIDDYKTVKESVGIGALDQFLAEFAELLRKLTDDIHMVARFGDQVFAVFSPHHDADAGQALAEAIVAGVRDKLFEVGTQAVSLTCSIGLTPVDPDDHDPQQCLAQADLACDTASSQGGNRVQRHNPVSFARASQDRDQLMIEMIKDAGQHGRFRLHYQPIMSLHGSAEENYEVFLRMLDEAGDLVPPSQFIPAAERSGQIVNVERWVIANAVHILSKRHRSGADTTLFINLSGANFADPGLGDWLREHLEKTQLRASALVFEMHEADIVGHIGEARALARKLADLGCRLLIDHFGSSPTSFNCLKHIPAQMVKLDRSFITALKGSEGLNELKEITRRAHDAEVRVIAEFVEDPTLLSPLWQCQVDFIQGYFLQEPSPTMSFDFQGESL
ncbi:MAG TPA: EAL domain-containing protein [Gammaproteobacteria bacterium]